MSNAEVLKQYIDSGFTLELEALPSDEINPTKWVSIYAINGMQAKLGSLHYLVKSGVKLRVAKEKRRVRICEMKNMENNKKIITEWVESWFSKPLEYLDTSINSDNKVQYSWIPIHNTQSINDVRYIASTHELRFKPEPNKVRIAKCAGDTKNYYVVVNIAECERFAKEEYRFLQWVTEEMELE